MKINLLLWGSLLDVLGGGKLHPQDVLDKFHNTKIATAVTAFFVSCFVHIVALTQNKPLLN
jgi:hypothetical protein